MKSKTARIITRHFRKAGQETKRIRLFENLSGPERAELISRLAIDPEEEPVLVASLSPKGYLVLSASRAIVDLPSGLQSLRYSIIDQVTVDRVAEVLLRGRGKHLWQTLKLELTSGETLNLVTEPGKGFWGLFNAFKFQADRSPAARA